MPSGDGEEGCPASEGRRACSITTRASHRLFPSRITYSTHDPHHQVLPPAKLPADTTPEMVPVVITDTSSRVEDQEVLHAACRSASVIVLCFRMDEDGSGNRGGDAANAGSASLRRVSSFWMPELKRLHVKVPVLLVGCKSDLRPADESLHKAVLPVIKAYPQIETCMECSVRPE